MIVIQNMGNEYRKTKHKRKRMDVYKNEGYFGIK
jgi:hypothetical protein